jgi:hypothetical protein
MQSDRSRTKVDNLLSPCASPINGEKDWPINPVQLGRAGAANLYTISHRYQLRLRPYECGIDCGPWLENMVCETTNNCWGVSVRQVYLFGLFVFVVVVAWV